MLTFPENANKNIGNLPSREENIGDTVAELKGRIAYLERIIKVSQIVNSTLELGPLLQIISKAGIELAKSEGCSILLYDYETKSLKFMPSTFSTDENITVPLEGSIAGIVFQKAKPILIRDVKTDPRWNNQVDQASDFETSSILGVPLKIKNEVIGVLELVNKVGNAEFGHEDIQIATALAAQAAIAIENARLLEQVQHAYNELSELDRLKSEFVTVASHELRTPLAVVLGYASFLRNQVTEEGSEQLNMVLASAMKLRNLIDDMVNLRHVKSDNLQLEATIFSMRDLAVEALVEFQTMINAKSLRVSVQLPEGNDDPVNVEADRQKVYLILANLISNAVKFTSEQGAIIVAIGRLENKIFIRVSDTGVGIPKEQQVRIFEDFYQVEHSLTRRFEGLGIGLSITKGMVDVHKGVITVKSVEHRGSQFEVLLPISQQDLSY